MPEKVLKATCRGSVRMSLETISEIRNIHQVLQEAYWLNCYTIHVLLFKNQEVFGKICRKGQEKN